LGYLRVLEARSETTAISRLRVLAGDDIRPVRLWTARNRNAPPDALDRLSRDEDHSVRWNALLHRGLPAGALEAMAAAEAAVHGSRWLIARAHIVHHPNVPTTLRQQLLDAGACRTCPDRRCAGFRVYI
jgi:hypothetical protein